MSRPRGGFIGHNPAPAATALNSAAGGIWTLREAEELKRAGTWPRTDLLPTDLSGLQLWLDASDDQTLFDATSGGSLVAADGGVARWEDKSGNDRHATQGTAANRPARKTAVQGGKDVLRFDGSNDQLSVPGSTATFKFLHSASATVFFVASPTQVTDGDDMYVLLSTGSLSSANIGYSLFYEDRTAATGGNQELRVYTLRGVSGSTFIDTLGTGNNLFVPNQSSVASVRTKNDATAANRADVRINKSDQGATNSSTSAPSTSNSTFDLHIGSGVSSFYWNGDISEIIMYDSALSDTDRELVENYLLAKWSIT